ncbi:pyrroline-5-carboxylate reductase family protein [Evtepia gabavorous]|uniref:pyrroline-5-carboxylate reductase family protein n=1 Tax=Evtepia gabavorous TaxID=2211183 RepID=UPI00399A08FD
MGGAIARAVSLTLKDGILADHSPQRAQELAAELGFSSGTNEDAARESQYLFLGVKPHLMGGMLEGIRPTLASRETSPILVSMAAGLTIAQIQQMAGQKYPVIRIMPNTPVAVREGVVLYETSANVTADMMDGFLNMMSQAGKLFHLEESLMDVGAAVSGCGPAYAYLILDAMAGGGVACGLPRPDAVRFAAQTLLGAAKWYWKLETSRSIKNDVCSPGGSTIQGPHTRTARCSRRSDGRGHCGLREKRSFGKIRRNRTVYYGAVSFGFVGDSGQRGETHLRQRMTASHPQNTPKIRPPNTSVGK